MNLSHFDRPFFSINTRIVYKGSINALYNEGGRVVAVIRGDADSFDRYTVALNNGGLLTGVRSVSLAYP